MAVFLALREQRKRNDLMQGNNDDEYAGKGRTSVMDGQDPYNRESGGRRTSRQMLQSAREAYELSKRNPDFKKEMEFDLEDDETEYEGLDRFPYQKQVYKFYATDFVQLTSAFLIVLNFLFSASAAQFGWEIVPVPCARAEFGNGFNSSLGNVSVVASLAGYDVALRGYNEKYQVQGDPKYTDDIWVESTDAAGFVVCSNTEHAFTGLSQFALHVDYFAWQAEASTPNQADFTFPTGWEDELTEFKVNAEGQASENGGKSRFRLTGADIACQSIDYAATPTSRSGRAPLSKELRQPNTTSRTDCEEGWYSVGLDGDCTPAPGERWRAADTQLIFQNAEYFFLAIFTFELVVNMYGAWWSKFWESNWNVFDFIVIVASWVAEVFPSMPGVAILRLFRTFRIMRLFKRLVTLRIIIEGIVASLPGVLNAFIVTGIMMGIWAIMGVDFFKDEMPNEFGNFIKAMYTMWKIMTLEGWTTMADLLIHTHNMPMAAVYFISYTFLVGIVMSNVVVAILLERYLATVDEGFQKSKGGNSKKKWPPNVDEALKAVTTGKYEETIRLCELICGIPHSEEHSNKPKLDAPPISVPVFDNTVTAYACASDDGSAAWSAMGKIEVPVGDQMMWAQVEMSVSMVTIE